MRCVYVLNKDLRFHDNEALLQASQSDELMFVYLFPASFDKGSSYKKHFIFESLKDFQTKLRLQNQNLYLLSDITSLFEISFEQLIISEVFNAEDQQVINSLKDLCHKNKVEFKSFNSSTLYEKQQLGFLDSEFPKSFSAFRGKLEKQKIEISCVDSENLKLPPCFKPPRSVQSLEVINIEGEKNKNFDGGETFGLERLNEYLWQTHAIQNYKHTRNGLINFNDSSKFSPWLALGCLSSKQVYLHIQNYEQQVIKNSSTYWLYFELLWREYFKFYSDHMGQSLFALSGPQQRLDVEVSQDQKEAFKAWCDGETGNKFINANMKELKQTGWMSNRGRQNVANYLAKILKVNWTWGARWFENNLIDYDVESNWGNWAYQAGVGSDVKDRIFNPEKQSQMYDPNKVYESIWLTK